MYTIFKPAGYNKPISVINTETNAQLNLGTLTKTIHELLLECGHTLPPMNEEWREPTTNECAERLRVIATHRYSRTHTTTTTTTTTTTEPVPAPAPDTKEEPVLSLYGTLARLGHKIKLEEEEDD